MKVTVKTPPYVPAVTLKATARAPASQHKLMEQAAEKAQSLLATSPRVLVVYGEDGARLYCEGDSHDAQTAPSGEAEQDEPASGKPRRKR